MATLLGLKAESERLRNLDFLRLVASLGVVFLHSHEFFYPREVRGLVTARNEELALFVDLFFIVSGFVMAMVYGKRIGSFLDYLSFLWKRVARLYPLHLVVLALNIALWALLSTQGSSDSMPSFSARCIIPNALLLQEYIGCDGNQFNGVTWSISVEMGLYVLLPIFLLAAGFGRAAIVLLAVACVALAAAFLHSGWQWLALPPFLRGLAGFSTGCALWFVRDRLPGLPHAGRVVLVLTSLCIVAMMTDIPQWVVVLLLFLLALVAVIADRDDQASALVDTIYPLSQLTYSLYIWHRLIILAFMNVVADKLFYGNVPVLVAMTALTYVALFGASYAGYFLIEHPARRALNRAFPRRDGKPTVAVTPAQERGREHAP